jgi:hypothetical protein
MRALSSCVALAMLLLPAVHASAQETAQRAGIDRLPEQSPPGATEGAGTSRAPDHTVPASPDAQPQAPIADQAKPAAVGPAQADSAGSVPGDVPPGATAQTMPSTRSGENAALDKLPITALQFPLSDDEKALIAKGVAAAPVTPAEVDLQRVHVADFLPPDVPMAEFPPEVTQQFPRASRYKYVKLAGSILIVDPPLLAIVQEVKP